MNSFKFNKNDTFNIIKLGNITVPVEKIDKLTEILNELYRLVMQNDETEAHFREFIRHNGAKIQQDKARLNKDGVAYTMEDLFSMQTWIKLMFNYIDSSSANR